MKFLFSFIILFSIFVNAQEYHVGPNHNYINIGDVPWAELQAGDTVFIHWRSEPYREKWVINRQGTEHAPISVIGISNSHGQKPVIDGHNATTANGLNYWNEQRGLIKIGGSNIPADALPQHIIIDNLEIRSAHPDYTFSNDNGEIQQYSSNAAAIYVEKGEHITLRNCIIHDAGNGIFVGAFNGQTAHILIEKNHIYGNGIVGSAFEHNTYTAAIDIIYQYNQFGSLRAGANGNNLKDRSAGLKVRYNWIEDGNRQLDLVDAEDSSVLVNHPDYSKTFVYGNVLIEPDGAGNSQIIHYGGDSGNTNDYRKGDLYLFNNTIISTRNGNTTLIRLSTNDENVHIFNNIIYNTANGSNMALIDGTGSVQLKHNWLPLNWRDCHCTPEGTISDLGNNMQGNDPLFVDFSHQNFHVSQSALTIDAGTELPPDISINHNVNKQYKKHHSYENRVMNNALDLGAFEYCDAVLCDLIFSNGFDGS